MLFNPLEFSFLRGREGKGKMLKGLVKKLIGIAEGNTRISRNDRNASSSRSSVFRLFEAQRELFFLPRAPRDERSVCAST